MFKSMVAAVTEDYRSILKRELEVRCQTNPRYSLRAFARDLMMSPPLLSQVINERRGLSRDAAARIARRLGMNRQESDRFCDLVDVAHARSRLRRQAAKARLEKGNAKNEFAPLAIEAFRVVSDWYHWALTQVISLDGFRYDVSSIAKTLGITQVEASSAINRLKRLNIIEERGGTLKTVEDYVMSPDGVPSEAIRKFHRQILAKAAEAIDLQTIDERDFSSMIFPVPISKLSDIRAEIRAFEQKLCQKYGAMQPKDEVYCLGVQFFRLSKSRSRETKNG